MKGLRRFLDRIKPDFEPGGRFGRLHSTFDAFETFLFVPDKTTQDVYKRQAYGIGYACRAEGFVGDARIPAFRLFAFPEGDR